VIDNIGDLLHSLLGMLNACLSLIAFKLYLLDHTINNISLSNVLLSSPLEIFHNRYDHERELAELLERNLDLFGSFSIALVHLVILICILHDQVLSITSCLPLFASLKIDVLLNIRKLNVTLDNVNIRVAHEAADFSNIVRLDLIVTVSTGHALTQTNQTLELTHSDFIGRTALSSLFSSKITKKRSKRDMIGGEMSTLKRSDFERSYLPNTGLAAARIEDLALSVA